MRLIRELERRLEYLLDGVAGRFFRGPLHPSELAANLVRRLDLEIDESMVAPNQVDIIVAATDLDGPIPDAISIEIAAFLEDAAAERGWRLEGPAAVTVRPDPAVGTGRVRMSTRVRRGARRPWAVLQGDRNVDLTVNRCVIGRDSGCDVVLTDDRVSRRHALLWTEAGRTFVIDLGSGNGTRVDGRVVRSEPTPVDPGSVLTFGPVSFRYQVI